MSRSLAWTAALTACLISSGTSHALAAGEVAPLDVRSMGCGMLAIQVGRGYPSWRLCPATLPSQPGWGAEMAYFRLYSLPQLGVRQVSLHRGFSRFGLGIGLSNFGWEAYRETTVEMGVAGGAKKVRLGATALIVRSEYRRYASRTWVAFMLSSEVQVNRAIRVQAVTGDLLPHGESPVGRSTTVSFIWKWAELLGVGLGLVKEPGLPLEVRTGISYTPVSALTLRAGLTQSPQRLAAGCTFHVAGVSLSYAYVDHADLGSTHAVSMAFGRLP